jgi:hypothetical protein
MAEKRSFQDRQYAFAAHIRDPEHRPAPEGIEDRRMAIYRDLFFNNLKNLLATFYPVLRKLHDDEHWKRFIRRFMQVHQAKTPYFLELPEEFLNFLDTEYEPEDDDYPFLKELAHYEYIELALSVSEAENDLDGADPGGDLLAGAPQKSELCWVYAYNYPVHRIATDFLPDAPSGEPVYLAVYRDSEGSVGFLELNPVTAGLLNAIEQNTAGLSGEDLLRAMAAEIGYPDADAFVRHGASALAEMRELEILTGTRAPGT